MAIEQYATRNVVMVSEEASLHEAAHLMKEENVGTIVVVKNKETDLTPRGILTDRDIVIRLLSEDGDPKQIRVKDISTHNLLVIQQGQGVQETIKALTDKGVRRAPVVDANNKIIGIITLDDLLLLVIEELQCLAGLIKKQMT
jgi:CBS domain-containing protein